MKVFVCVLVVAFLALFGYSMYRDGYQTGVFEERRKRIRIEINQLKGEIKDIRNNMPLTFDHEHTDEPIGKVLYSEECDGGLKFHIKEVESDVRTAD